MECAILGFLGEARAAIHDEQESGGSSRALSLALTKIEEAILWREEDIRIKFPRINESNW